MVGNHNVEVVFLVLVLLHQVLYGSQDLLLGALLAVLAVGRFLVAGAVHALEPTLHHDHILAGILRVQFNRLRPELHAIEKKNL